MVANTSWHLFSETLFCEVTDTCDYIYNHLEGEELGTRMTRSCLEDAYCKEEQGGVWICLKSDPAARGEAEASETTVAPPAAAATAPPTTTKTPSATNTSDPTAATTTTTTTPTLTLIPQPDEEGLFVYKYLTLSENYRRAIGHGKLPSVAKCELNESSSSGEKVIGIFFFADPR